MISADELLKCGKNLVQNIEFRYDTSLLGFYAFSWTGKIFHLMRLIQIHALLEVVNRVDKSKRPMASEHMKLEALLKATDFLKLINRRHASGK